jgi:hypothetical protein
MVLILEANLLETPMPTALPRTMGARIDAAGLANSRSGKAKAGMKVVMMGVGGL